MSWIIACCQNLVFHTNADITLGAIHQMFTAAAGASKHCMFPHACHIFHRLAPRKVAEMKFIANKNNRRILTLKGDLVNGFLLIFNVVIRHSSGCLFHSNCFIVEVG